jgi:uncharacterized protein YkwD
MMIKLHGLNAIVAACVTALALAACGPGGPKQETNAASSSSIPPTGVSGQDSTAPALTNKVATDGRAWINYRRSQVGMSVLAENAQIDVAAQGHSDYQRINSADLPTHVQVAGKQGFTGAQLQDRLANAGYVINTKNDNAIGEVISATKGGNGFTMAEELITAIYHRFVIFEPVFKEIGSGSATTPANYTYFTADFAANNGYGPGLAKGVLATWPFSGQIDVPVNFFTDNEEPDPVPDKGINEVGYPVSVHANLTSSLAVQSFTIHAHGTSTNLTTRLLAQATDPNMSTNTSAAAIIPLSKLAAGTTYDVSFSGTIDGAPVSKTWSFTTAK